MLSIVYLRHDLYRHHHQYILSCMNLITADTLYGVHLRNTYRE